MNRRKMTGLIASLLAAAVGTFAIIQWSSKPAPVAAPVEAQVTVLKVTKPIPKGTPASQLAEFVQPVSVPVSAQQPETAATLEEIAALNMVANADLLVGDQVSKLRFSAPGNPSSSEIVGAAGSENFDDLIGVWVNLAPINALNGNIKPGVTRVAVFAAFEPLAGVGSDPTKDVSTNHLIAHKVPVLDMYPAPGAVLPPVEGQPAAATPIPPAFQVKLGLDSSQAEKIVFAQLKGTIYLGEEAVTAPEAETQVVDRGNVYEGTPKPVLGKDNKAPKLLGGVTPASLVPPVKPEVAAGGVVTTAKPADAGGPTSIPAPGAAAAAKPAGGAVTTAPPTTAPVAPVAVAAAPGSPLR